jgi:protein-disulfide isomerase
MKQRIAIILLIVSIIMGCTSPNTKPSAQNDTQKETTSKKAASVGPVIEIKKKTIDIGTITYKTNEITGKIDLFNAGDEPLKIEKVDGPCACYMGYLGDELLQPKKSGELKVMFDKNKIPAGAQVTRNVRIHTNDPDNPMVEVFFTFVIEREPAEEQLRNLGEQIGKLKDESEMLREEIKAVLTQFRSNAAPELPADSALYSINIGTSPTLGPKDAPITIVAFFDFQCPFCIHEIPKIKGIVKDHPGKVRAVFKHHPLEYHKKAKPAHAAAELANIEGGSDAFWKMYDLIMANFRNMEISDLRKYAESLGLNMARFDETMADPNKIDKLLDADIKEGIRCSVGSTPTVFINSFRLTDRERSVQKYEQIIGDILAKKDSSH